MNQKFKIGLLTMSDGREYIHNDLLEINVRYQAEIKQVLEATGRYEVIEGTRIINSNTVAKEEAQRLATLGAEMTIFNYAIWCFPAYTAVAANFAPAPYLLFCNLHPSECGMVGMLAAAGSLNQLGITYERIWGSIRDDAVLKKVCSYLDAAVSVKRLKGLTYGCFGGRALGMYTAVANQELSQKTFGIDIENIEQEKIRTYGNRIDDEKVEHALAWLEEHVGHIGYNDTALTPDKLRQQIRSYYGLRTIIDEYGLDFVGIKAHGDVTEDYITMDIAEAFLNDPYDWDGSHEPIVAATESDFDGAVTMQLFKHLTGKPVLFADVRHYDKEDNVWFFSNSGTHATYFAEGSDDPAVNLKSVSFLPEVEDYPSGGASVQHFAAEGKVTLARLARYNGSYKLSIVPAEIVRFDWETMLKKSKLTTPEWPIAFTRLKVSADEFLAHYPCNHIHGVYGDYVDRLVYAAKILGIEYEIYE